MTTTQDSQTTGQRGTSMEQRIGPRGRFTVRQSSGEIRVRGVEGESVRVRSLDNRDLDGLFEIEAGDDRLVLRQREHFGIGLLNRREGAELEIEVPHGASVSIEAASADI